jgi:hypothetical protein
MKKFKFFMVPIPRAALVTALATAAISLLLTHALKDSRGSTRNAILLHPPHLFDFL